MWKQPPTYNSKKKKQFLLNKYKYFLLKKRQKGRIFLKSKLIKEMAFKTIKTSLGLRPSGYIYNCIKIRKTS